MITFTCILLCITWGFVHGSEETRDMSELLRQRYILYYYKRFKVRLPLSYNMKDFLNESYPKRIQWIEQCEERYREC